MSYKSILLPHTASYSDLLNRYRSDHEIPMNVVISEGG
jgi:hypothetical protein